MKRKHDFEAELSRQQERVEQAQRQAEAALRVRSEFLANVSHELRTPMNSILGMLQLARDEPLSPVVRDYLEAAQSSAASLLDLLNDILDFSRLELGKFTIDEAPFRLRPAIDEALKSVSPAAFSKGLEVVCDIAGDVPDLLVGDEMRLRQILLNLVGNAVKFTETGEIVLRVSTQRLWPSEARLKFSVRDTGIGIAPQDQKRIFEAFAQADASTTRRHGGVGLGLAISNELLHCMGSRLMLVSEQGRGSDFSFIISFPRPPVERTAQAEAAGLAQLHGLSVLIVDDNETNRRILEQMLRGWQLQPVVAADAEQALALLRDASRDGHPFACALVDALMPGTDGLALSQKIREDQEICRPPVVLMISSADRRAFAERADALAVSHFLTKPVSQAELSAALVECLPSASAKGGSQPDPSPAPRQPLAVLVAEDTPANQKMVLGVLKKRGHEVTIAQNGREAVDVLRKRPFDVVLMDVQMPIMDGFQATAAIRAMQNGAAQATPIIAMTAHALRGDREKCLAAGMDAYLSKPIDVWELIEKVEGVERDERGTERIIDFDGVMRRLAGDRELFQELAQMFHEDAPQLLAKLDGALAAGDAATAQRAAHSLKGLAANFGARACVDAAQEFESAPRDVLADTGPPLAASLRERVQELSTALAPYCEG